MTTAAFDDANSRLRWRWPLPALLTWALGWALYRALALAGAPLWLAALAGSVAGCACAWRARSRLRAAVIAAGFPLSLLASGAAPLLPAWAWLLPLALLWLLYPQRAWRDAPLFPTPRGAIDALAEALPLPPLARVLDAGCGLGHGLRALRRAYPQARLEGVEWSWPLAWLARLRLPGARVRRGDMWRFGWGGFDLVYLFQRPQSMARAWAKARAEMKPGAWLASLEFEIEGVRAQQVLRCPDGRALWLYRLPAPAPAQAARPRVSHVSSGTGVGR